MKTPTKLLAPLAAASLALAPLAVALTPTAAYADHANGTYQTTLDPLNGSTGSGMATVTIDDTQATVELSWSGLPQTFQDGPYPHVQHVHIGNRGECPTQSMDGNGDGIVDTVEGQPAYGAVGTTLSLKGGTGADQATNINTAPGGSSIEYSRTFEMNADTLDALANGTGVIVVHGLDPATLSDQAANAKSNLAPQLPLAATAPALCGALSGMPSGGVETGGGSTAGVDNAGILALGGGALAAAAVGGVIGRRRLFPARTD